MANERILVTGASGYLGSHIVQALVNSGYNVRATARPAKVADLQAAYDTTYNTNGSNKAQVVATSDLVHGVFPEIFEGIDALIHVASPLPGKEEPEALIDVAVEATQNILRQAEKAGITRIVVTSSIASVWKASPDPLALVLDTGSSWTDWNPTTKEVALKTGNPLVIYAASKTYAERAVWEFADAHPHVDITTLNPPFFYGPFAPTQSFPTFDASALSTAGMLYRLLSPDGVYPPNAEHIDVRDVAKAHVLALKSPPTSVVGRKRIIIASPHGLNFATLTDFLAEKRPALKDRLTKETPPKTDRYNVPLDFARVEQVLGLKKSDFYDFEDTILDTIDQLLELEAGWKSAML
ncbi:NAD(P)-binding protein [Pleurotus eryngii]|uniref:NAD(P)-binding protein n=1 Tax=Pleurotus eryngii TaxID=5323 RepID=A0A9P6DCK0_PLEER|nr:NAD(P)-binding protein [Pleurotus eryngii]